MRQGVRQNVVLQQAQVQRTLSPRPMLSMSAAQHRQMPMWPNQRRGGLRSREADASAQVLAAMSAGVQMPSQHAASVSFGRVSDMLPAVRPAQRYDALSARVHGTMSRCGSHSAGRSELQAGRTMGEGTGKGFIQRLCTLGEEIVD